MKKIIDILILFTLILVSTGCKPTDNTTLLDNIVYPSFQREDFGKIQLIIEYGDHSVIGAHFPTFGIDKIDSITKDLILSEIDKFKCLIKGFSTENEDYKSELNIDYETYQFSDNIISIKFIILEDLSYYPHPNTMVITKTYDLAAGKSIELDDIMEGNYLDEIPVSIVSSENNTDLINLEEPSSIIPAPTRDLDPTKPMVALTFDDGPNKNTTIPILDTLKEYGGVATFFVLGNRVHNNKDILRRMQSEGSEIGNHSFNHKQLTTITSSEIGDQINKTQEAVIQVMGSKPKLMRPTYGSYNNNLKSQIELPMILWSIDTLDWKSKNAEKISNHVLTNIKDGDIVLMHDIYGSTADAIKTIVPELIHQGYQLVTVSELYESRNQVLKVGNIYSNSYKE